MEDQRTLEGHIGCLSLLPRAMICHSSNQRLHSGGPLSYLGTARLTAFALDTFFLLYLSSFS